MRVTSVKHRKEAVCLNGKRGKRMRETFITRNGVEKEGYMIRQYPAFEGGMRYIFQTDNGEYRCVKDENGKYVEYVA